MPRIEHTATITDFESPAPPTGDTTFTGQPEPTAPEGTPATHAPVTPDDTGDDAPERDQHGRFHPRGRRGAKSVAGPGDVPRIKELTSKWRGEEDAHKATKAERDALKSEIERLKSRNDSEAKPPTRETVRSGVASEGSGTGTPTDRKAPELDSYVGKEGVTDPYAAWLRDVAKFDRDTERLEAEAAQAVKAKTTEADKAQREVMDRYQKNRDAYETANPGALKAIQDSEIAKVDLTPTIHAAIIGLDNGTAIAYYLSQHPADFAELHLATEGKAATEQSVANVQRWFTARKTAGTTGAAPAPRTTPQAPPPPTPVRTRPVNAGDDPPADGSGYDAHAAYWGPKPGQRRRRLG